MNTYQYARANPFKWTDRSGLDPSNGNGTTTGICPGGSLSAVCNSSGPYGDFLDGDDDSDPDTLGPLSQIPYLGGGGGGGGGLCSWLGICGSFTATIGDFAISGDQSASQDWGIGGDTAGNICYVKDLCVGNPTQTAGELWSGGGSWSASDDTLQTSTTTSTQLAGGVGILGSVGGSVTLGPDGWPTGLGVGIPRVGVGGGTGYSTMGCTTITKCFNLIPH
jgi:hypothetical protein